MGMGEIPAPTPIFDLGQVAFSVLVTVIPTFANTTSATSPGSGARRRRRAQNYQNIFVAHKVNAK